MSNLYLKFGKLVVEGIEMDKGYEIDKLVNLLKNQTRNSIVFKYKQDDFSNYLFLRYNPDFYNNLSYVGLESNFDFINTLFLN